jgi:hypothetical protein
LKEQRVRKGVKEKKEKRIRPILPARKMFTQRIILIVIPITAMPLWIRRFYYYEYDQKYQRRPHTSVRTQIGVRSSVRLGLFNILILEKPFFSVEKNGFICLQGFVVY